MVGGRRQPVRRRLRRALPLVEVVVVVAVGSGAEV